MGSRVSFGQIKKNIGLSLLAQVISLIVSFVMNLILPKYISEYQYAYWQIYLLYIGYVGILHFGLLDGIVLRYSQYDYDELDKPRIRSQFKCLLCLTGFFAFAGAICAAVLCEGEMRIAFVMVSIGIVTRTLFTYTSYSFQITNRINYYARMIIGYRVFYGVAVCCLILCGVNNFCLFCVVDLCSDLIGTFVGYLHNRDLYFGNSLKLALALDEAKTNISAGIMLMLANWSSFLVTGSARMIIQWHWDEITFGKVSFSFSVTSLFLTFVSAVSVVLFPSLKRMDERNLPDLYSKIRNIMSILLVTIMILYYPGCWLLDLWIPAYSESLIYLGILLPIILYSSKISLLTNNYLKALRKEKTMLKINAISVLIAVALFIVGAYVFNNLKLVLIFIVVAIMICSIMSEIVVMREFGFSYEKKFVLEILMTLVFIISATLFERIWGLVIYAVALAVFLFIKKNDIMILIKKRG